MNDTANQTNSYVDSYAPPAPSTQPPTTPSDAPTNDTPAPAVNANSEPAMSPPTSTPAPAAPQTAPPATSGQSQTLEDQNIFFLLGVEDVADEEKEAFLDELQQVIWEDFLENDVQLLITENENVELQQIMDKSYPSDLDKQEAIVVYLEKLIPDLEEVMLEKAMDLKREMVDERLVSMREVFATDAATLQTIDQAASLIQQDKWRDAAEMLNGLELKQPAA